MNFTEEPPRHKQKHRVSSTALEVSYNRLLYTQSLNQIMYQQMFLTAEEKKKSWQGIFKRHCWCPSDALPAHALRDICWGEPMLGGSPVHYNIMHFTEWRCRAQSLQKHTAILMTRKRKCRRHLIWSACNFLLPAEAMNSADRTPDHEELAMMDEAQQT